MSLRTFIFTPNYGDWPINSVRVGETELLQAHLSPALVADLKQFARQFQESYDYETGRFSAGVSLESFRTVYTALAQRLHDEGITVVLDYWWDEQPN